MNERPRRSAWSVLGELVVLTAAVLVAFEIGSRTAVGSAAAVVSLAVPEEPRTTLGLPESATRLADQPGWTRPTKVVVQDFWPGRTHEHSRVAPDIELVVAVSESALVAAAEDADGIMGSLTAAAFERASKLRWAQLPSAGVERYLAIPGLRESGLVVTNAQRIYAEGGAEHVLALVLALSRRLHVALALQRERSWNDEPLTGPAPYIGAGSELVELRGKTMLVAGLGGIGTEVARIAHGIGMRVIATRNSGRTGPPFVDYVGLADELPKLAGDADVIVNTLPHTPSTDQVFNEAFFAASKRGAFFVNVGRGKTVDTDALVRALRDGRLAGAGLDVTDPEPLPVAHPLWGLPNVIITPHVGGDSDGHMERMWLLFEENLRRFASGDRLLSVVDKQRGY
jgi:phosphoglycerate dehydrogenase-like enzyme